MVKWKGILNKCENLFWPRTEFVDETQEIRKKDIEQTMNEIKSQKRNGIILGDVKTYSFGTVEHTVVSNTQELEHELKKLFNDIWKKYKGSIIKDKTGSHLVRILYGGQVIIYPDEIKAFKIRNREVKASF